MDALDHYSIPVSGLHDGLHTYHFSIDADFFRCFEESPIRDGQVDVTLQFDKRPDMYLMSFNIEGAVKTACDRCLEEFDLPIESSQDLLVKFDEQESEDAEIIYILKDTPSLNVARFIYEFIILAIPIAKTHDDAGGRCDPEMLKFLKKEEEDKQLPPSNPVWDAFKGYNLEN